MSFLTKKCTPTKFFLLEKTIQVIDLFGYLSRVRTYDRRIKSMLIGGNKNMNLLKNNNLNFVNPVDKLRFSHFLTKKCTPRTDN